MNPLVAAGKLVRRVTIVRPTFTRNGDNERVEGEPVLTTRWASVRPAPGTERFQDAESAAEAPMRFVFRYEPGLVLVTDRLLHDDGRSYAIASVTEIGRREGWEVLATARGEVAP
jgi:head-tail adaptor